MDIDNLSKAQLKELIVQLSTKVETLQSAKLDDSVIQMAGLVLWSADPQFIEVQVGITAKNAEKLQFKNEVASVIARMRKSSGKPENSHSAYYAGENYVLPYHEYKTTQEASGFTASPMLRIMQAA